VERPVAEVDAALVDPQVLPLAECGDLDAGAELELDGALPVGIGPEQGCVAERFHGVFSMASSWSSTLR